MISEAARMKLGMICAGVILSEAKNL